MHMCTVCAQLAHKTPLSNGGIEIFTRGEIALTAATPVSLTKCALCAHTMHTSTTASSKARMEIVFTQGETGQFVFTQGELSVYSSGMKWPLCIA